MTEPGPNESRNRSVFVVEMTRHDQGLRRYLFKLLLDMQAVDEVMQETALALWEKVDEYDPALPFFPWACRFAYFKVLEYRKRSKRDAVVLEQDVLERVSYAAVESERPNQDRHEALASCLSQLTENDRELLSRRYQDGLQIKKMAAMMETPVKRLYNRLDRLRQRLADCVATKVASQNA
ncbi:MAG: sigma-70 family RNA polymerase sigma factor [Planctomycetota bacterium]